MKTTEEQDWTEEELSYADLGDKRLDQRFKKLLKDLSSNPRGNIPNCCDGWTETIAAYRFFQNEKVTSEKILESHRLRTIERMRECEVVLVVQDTTNLCYTTKREKIENLGYVDSPKDYGMLLHPTIAFTPDGLCLGVTTQQTVVRDVKEFGKGSTKKRDRLPIEEKESYRWLEGYREATVLQKQLPDTQVIMVADREADIYDIYEEASVCKTSWVIRAQHNRPLSGENKELKTGRLFDEIEKRPSIGTLEYNLPSRAKRKARQVTMTIRVTSETVSIPVDRKKSDFSPQRVNLIFAEEQNPPKGEDPIQWRILTNLPVESPEQAKQIIKYYVGRWGIECFFRILKTGCAIEELQLQDYDRLVPCISLYLIVAWRVMYLTHLGRQCPKLPCNAVFLDAEWKAAYIVAKQTKPPKNPPQLYEMICIIASFGGYLNRNSDPPPGAQALWIGIQRTRDFALGQMAMLNIKIDF